MNCSPFTYILSHLITNSIHAWLTKDYRSSGMSSAKIKFIASVVVEKNIFLNHHLYEHLKLGRLSNNSIINNGEHTEFITPLVITSQSIQVWVDCFCLEWINELSTDPILYHHNFTTTQAIFKQNRLAWSPERDNYR